MSTSTIVSQQFKYSPQAKPGYFPHRIGARVLVKVEKNGTLNTEGGQSLVGCSFREYEKNNRVLMNRHLTGGYIVALTA